MLGAAAIGLGDGVWKLKGVWVAGMERFSDGGWKLDAAGAPDNRGCGTENAGALTAICGNKNAEPA